MSHSITNYAEKAHEHISRANAWLSAPFLPYLRGQTVLMQLAFGKIT